MISFSNAYRSTQPEIMDDLDFQGAEMKKLLQDISFVNKWLGGNAITIDGLRKLSKNHDSTKPVTLLDIGCGNGFLLRKCSDFGQKNGIEIKCIGIDCNEHILEHAKTLSKNYPNITYKKIDVLLNEDLIPNCDIALCTLFLHHFSNEKIEILLNAISKKTTAGMIINDLHRSKVAFILFKVMSRLLLKTKTAKHDGLVSIASGFKKYELEKISAEIEGQQSEIKWRWAFRYQWIIRKNI